MLSRIESLGGGGKGERNGEERGQKSGDDEERGRREKEAREEMK